jgi:hypothetical protein
LQYGAEGHGAEGQRSGIPIRERSLNDSRVSFLTRFDEYAFSFP